MGKELKEIIEDLAQKRLSRRDFMVKASALGLSMSAIGTILAACGGGEATPAATETPTATAAATETGTAAATETITATPTTAAATETATGTAGGSKILRVRMYSDIQNMDPAFKLSANDDAVSTCVISSLVTYAPNSYDVVNDLAESIEQSDDGLTISFKLKEGVKWHDGSGTVSAEDVKFSYERIANPDLNSAYKDDWAALDHVEVVDELNGKIILKEPFAPLWKSTLPVGSGYVLPKKYVEKIGNEAFATQIMGSGPYIFSEWRPKEQVVLKRNPDYFGTAPYWDEIHFIPIEDDKAAEVAIEAGELDWTRISPGSIDRFEGNPQLKLWRKPSLRFRWIGMNVQHPKLQDINVRQAIRYGIDVPSILQATYFGKVEQETGIIAPGLIGHWADAPKYQRDVAKAKEFMAKAGLESLDLAIDIQDTSEYRTWAEIAQQNLQEIGINLTINPMDSSSFWELGMSENAPNLELFSNNYSMEPDPSWATVWFICSQIDIWNWMRWCNEEYDELHKKGLVTLDDAERERIYIEMQQIWDEACHTVWITHGSMDYAYLPTVKPATTPHGIIQPVGFEPA